MALALCPTAAHATILDRECAAYAGVAAVIAEAHQIGVPLANILEPLHNSQTRRLATYIYARFPRLQSEASQQQLSARCATRSTRNA